MNIKVISFNVRCADDKNGNTIEERAPRLAAVTLPYAADVIGFQEYTPKWAVQTEKYFGEEYEVYNVYRGEKSLESTPILWKRDKFNCLKKGTFWLSDTPEVESPGWDTWHCNRICTYAVLEDKASGEQFTFMNTHFGFSDFCQVSSASLIGEYAKKISDLPTFVTGDFNMTPDSKGYEEMAKYFDDANGLTVNDRRATFHDYDLSVKREDAHIDFCFIDKKVKARSFKIIDELHEGKFPSDHFGIYTELEI